MSIIVYGTRSRYSLEEGGHRGGPSSWKRVRGLQPVLRGSEEGWRIAIEPLSHETEVQDAYSQTGRVSDQVWGLVCHDWSKRRILPYLNLSNSQEVPEVCFRGRSLPISGRGFICMLYPGSSGERSVLAQSQFTSGSTVLAGPSMVLGPDFSPRLLSMGDSRQKGSFPFGSLTSKSLIMRVQWEHWMHTSTELPHGEGGPIARMLWYPKMDLPATNQTLSRWIVDAINTAYGSSQLPSSDGPFIRHWVWRPPRPFSQVSQCRTSAMLRDGLCPNLS